MENSLKERRLAIPPMTLFCFAKQAWQTSEVVGSLAKYFMDNKKIAKRLVKIAKLVISKGIDWHKLNEAEQRIKNCVLMVGEEKTLDDLEKRQFQDALNDAKNSIDRMNNIASLAKERFKYH